MITGKHFGSAIRLPALFIVLVAVPLAALGWLGWRLLEQERALESQRLRERIQDTTTLLSHEIDRAFAGWEDLLGMAAEGASVKVPEKAVVLLWNARGIERRHGVALPYHPVVLSPPEVQPEGFTEAETQELREKNLAKAAASYRRLASTTDRRLRAFALVRTARSLRNDHRIKEALEVYTELQSMGEVPVSSTPAALLALHERATLLTEIGDTDGASRESALLLSALWEGRFVVDRATFEFYGQSVPSASASANEALKMAEAVERLWSQWQESPSGRAAFTGDGRALATAWRHTQSGTVAILGPVDTLMASALATVSNTELGVSLEDAQGVLAWGVIPADPALVKTPRETGLPWTMRVSILDPQAAHTAALRRNLIIGGFGLLVLVITVASYVVFRSVGHELGVARLQSDFVAAVSHEFRTPLTALRHFAELLEEGGVESDRLPEYYRALGKESRRLQGTVESLLDFGRMEDGRRPYQMDEINAGEFTRRVVDDFRDHAAFSGHWLDLHEATQPVSIQADHEALTLALRNLLDNAVKYSPESSEVRISVERRNGLARIAVADHGAGISREEQRLIFRKFSRGALARKMNVKGTGIGLTMADHIVRAHGGRIELVSEPGQGSTFTMVLPVSG